MITRQAAKESDLHSSGPLKWLEVSAIPKQKLIDEVKSKLAEEEIGESVPEDQLEKAIDWRMRQIFKARKRSPKRDETLEDDQGEKSSEEEDAEIAEGSERNRDENVAESASYETS